MHINNIVTAIAVTAILGPLLGAQPTAARNRWSATETVTSRISYGDLNLNSERGAKTMLRRIHFAALKVCGQTDDDRLDGGDQRRACIGAITNRTVASLGSPVVTDMNAGTPYSVMAAATPAKP